MDYILAATRAALISLFGIHRFIAPESDIGAAFAAPILLLSVGLLPLAVDPKHSRNPASSRIARGPSEPTLRQPMITAIVLIKAEPQSIPQVATKLAGIEGVSQVYSVSGEWDLVAMVEVTDYEGVASVVTEHILSTPGIKSTQTLTAFRAYSKKDLEQAWDIGLE